MKMNIKITFIAILSLLFIYATCCRDKKDCHYNVYINNNTDKAIYFNLSASYPDTLFYYNPTVEGDICKVNPHKHTNESHNSCVEGYYLQVPKLIYFIYDAQTLETTPWDTVKKKYMILKRYELTLQDLENMNWTVTYP